MGESSPAQPGGGCSFLTSSGKFSASQAVTSPRRRVAFLFSLFFFFLSNLKIVGISRFPHPASVFMQIKRERGPRKFNLEAEAVFWTTN